MFTDHFYPELGGIQDSVMLTARGLGSRGHCVEIFAPRHAAADFARIGLPPGELDLGPNVTIHRRLSWRVASSTQQSRAALPTPAALLTLLGRRRPDVIHSHSFFGLGLEALMAGRVLGVPVIGTNHTNVHGFAGFIPVAVERAAEWVIRYYNRCEAITAPSRAVFDGLGLDRMHQAPTVISNPIDVECFQPTPAAGRSALKRAFGLGDQVIAFAGRLAAEKNIDIILHALALLPDGVQLALAGHGAHEQPLRALAARLGLASRVIFVGTLPPARLAQLFGAAELFVMMSRSETQSMVSLQAMACGLPVVATDQGALTEYVSDATGRLAPSDNAPAIAAAIGGLLDNPVLRQSLGLAARTEAARHSLDIVTERWIALYLSQLPAGGMAWSAAG